MNAPSLRTDLVKRAAALAVSRYGVDAKRVARALQIASLAQADGVSGDLLDLLVAQAVLTASQAEELRRELQTDREPTAVVERTEPVTQRPVASTTNGTTSPTGGKTPLPPTRSGYHLCAIGGYRLLRRLGEGGMGTVYLAYSEIQGRQVAIKVLADRLASNASYVDRFLREARNGARLDHPNVVRCIEAGRDAASGKHYLVMEYVDGPSARSLLDRFGQVPIGDAVHLTLEIARALKYVHARDFVHRDIKPDNILITTDGVAKLADLGLAKCVADASQLTGAKQGFGTPYYMPCEQAVDATRADARADIYALGATLYHLVTGLVPFPGESHLQIAERKLAGTYAPVSTVVPEAAALDPILERMLAQDPEDRYQKAQELIGDLERTGLDRPSSQAPGPDARDTDTTEEADSAGQMTQVDMDMPQAVHEAPWYVRYRERDGQWCSVRGTTAQIIQKLRTGVLPRGCEVARTPQGKYQPAASVPEFQSACGSRTPTPPPSPSSSPPLPTLNLAVTPSGAIAWNGVKTVVGVVLTALAVAAGALLYFLTLRA